MICLSRSFEVNQISVSAKMSMSQSTIKSLTIKDLFRMDLVFKTENFKDLALLKVAGLD